ncbi:MAG: toll/interleukin-1 receptor domain-containing protein [Chloroflexota bacterium]|nr:toll/interleukin-1 receptor domain-containing protein [Chloroflexota bacterium]
MAHIFVSYSRKDKDYARKLVDHLLALGFDVWFDEHIEYGSNWEQAIQRAIDTCAAFIVVMSPASADSEWVHNESAHAADRSKAIYPLLLDGEAFLRFKTTQYVDVRGGVLPSDEFIAKLAEHAPRASHFGKRYGSAESGGIRTFQRPPSVPAPTQTRRLESAMPRQTQRAVPTEVRIKISLPDSVGLRGELPDVTEYGDEIKKGDVRESGFPLTFPVDANGNPLPIKLCTQVESDHYDVRYPANDCGAGQAEIELPPNTDSRTVVVALYPRDAAYVGRASVTVRLLREGRVVAENVVVTRVVEQVQELAYGMGSTQIKAVETGHALSELLDLPRFAEREPYQSGDSTSIEKSIHTGNTDVTKSVRREQQSASSPSAPAPAAASPIPSVPDQRLAPPTPIPQRKSASRGRLLPFAGLVGILLAGIVGVLTLTNRQNPIATATNVSIAAAITETAAASALATQMTPTLSDTGGGALTGSIVDRSGAGEVLYYRGSPTTGFTPAGVIDIGRPVIVTGRATVQVTPQVDDDDDADISSETWLQFEVLEDARSFWIPVASVQLSEGTTLEEIPEWTG